MKRSCDGPDGLEYSTEHGSEADPEDNREVYEDVQYEKDEGDTELGPPEPDLWIEEDEVPKRDALPLVAAIVAFGGSIYLGGQEGLTMAGVVLTLIYMLIG